MKQQIKTILHNKKIFILLISFVIYVYALYSEFQNPWVVTMKSGDISIIRRWIFLQETPWFFLILATNVIYIVDIFRYGLFCPKATNKGVIRALIILVLGIFSSVIWPSGCLIDYLDFCIRKEYLLWIMSYLLLVIFTIKSNDNSTAKSKSFKTIKMIMVIVSVLLVGIFVGKIYAVKDIQKDYKITHPEYWQENVVILNTGKIKSLDKQIDVMHNCQRMIQLYKDTLHLHDSNILLYIEPENDSIWTMHSVPPKQYNRLMGQYMSPKGGEKYMKIDVLNMRILNIRRWK